MKKKRFKFRVTKWDETGNILLESYTRTIQRQFSSSAKNYLRKQFTWGEGYEIELISNN